jgi:hypothetical protein
VVFDQLAHAAAARRSKVDHHRGVAAWAMGCVLEPGSAMSVVVIHALPLCCEEGFRARQCGVEVEGCMYV